MSELRNRGRKYKVPIASRAKIIARRVAEGEDLKDLAKEYGLKLKTAKQYLQRGRKELEK